MRVWDVNPSILCRKHLLGEHRELHGLWNILTKHGGVGGYSKHPETKRWIGKLAALRLRHEKLIVEMKKRNYRHFSELEEKIATGSRVQTLFIHSKKEQLLLLKNKNCECPLDA